LRKAIPYLIGFLLIVALIFLFSSKQGEERLPDGRITLGRNDKIPYGTWVAFHQLKDFFPKANVLVNRDQPGSWDSLSTYDSAQALIIIAPRFLASEYEMQRLISFAQHGNEVFISSRYLSNDAETLTGNYASSFTEHNTYINDVLMPDTFGTRLLKPVFPADQLYTFPGEKFDVSFYRTDSSYAEILGRDLHGEPDFIRLRAGKGHIYMHLAPIAFSNYFLLHQQNMHYYEQVLSLIPPSVKKIAWDEYYLGKKDGEDDPDREKWLSVLFHHKALRAALLTAILILFFYTLLEMRRKQRIIPVMSPPRNDSMDFVKTIGRLYYDKADHRNLCRKMGAYFLEHVRNRYKLPTGNLDESFMQLLQFKSGAPEQDIRGIVTFIKYAEDAPVVTADELAQFHDQLESFYQKA
jgi:hypothetical protein